MAMIMDDPGPIRHSSEVIAADIWRRVKPDILSFSRNQVKHVVYLALPLLSVEILGLI